METLLEPLHLECHEITRALCTRHLGRCFGVALGSSRDGAKELKGSRMRQEGTVGREGGEGWQQVIVRALSCSEKGHIVSPCPRCLSQQPVMSQGLLASPKVTGSTRQVALCVVCVWVPPTSPFRPQSAGLMSLPLPSLSSSQRQVCSPRAAAQAGCPSQPWAARKVLVANGAIILRLALELTVEEPCSVISASLSPNSWELLGTGGSQRHSTGLMGPGQSSEGCGLGKTQGQNTR